jgi:hypothetical protein
MKALVKHFESLYDLNANLPHFFESSKKEKFISTFSEYINRYMPQDGLGKELLSTCNGENSLRINEKVVSHFPLLLYNGIEDLAKTIMKPANCHSSRVTIPVQDKSDLATPEHFCVYTDLSNQIWSGFLRETLNNPILSISHRLPHI